MFSFLFSVLSLLIYMPGLVHAFYLTWVACFSLCFFLFFFFLFKMSFKDGREEVASLRRSHSHPKTLRLNNFNISWRQFAFLHGRCIFRSVRDLLLKTEFYLGGFVFIFGQALECDKMWFWRYCGWNLRDTFFFFSWKRCSPSIQKVNPIGLL